MWLKTDEAVTKDMLNKGITVSPYMCKLLSPIMAYINSYIFGTDVPSLGNHNNKDK
jgi:hypothetical protein